MNPFPANSISDTENEQISASEQPTTASSSFYHQLSNNNASNSNGPQQPSSQTGNTTPQSVSSSNNNNNHAYSGQRGGGGGFFGNGTHHPNGNNSSNGNHHHHSNNAKANNILQDVESFVEREMLAVLVWSLAVPLLSLAVVRLHEKAEQRHGTDQNTLLRQGLATLSWLLLQVLPHQLPHGRCPGVLLSNVWLLQFIRYHLGVYPNLGCRIAEWRLGRLSKRALVLVGLVHTLVPCFVWGLLGLLSWFSDAWNRGHQAEAALYSYNGDDATFQATFFAKEVLVNALFPVAVLVVPLLLKLNDFPSWLSLFVVYPLYNMAVAQQPQVGNTITEASAQRGSSLSVGAIAAQSILQGKVFWGLIQNWRLWAQLLGNVLGGFVMEHVFPDEPNAAVTNS